jgi:hypothetical protein
MNARGFVLLEWLVAAALVMSVAGAAFAIVGPARDVVERTQHRIDLANSAERALAQIVAEVREAGSLAAIAETDVSVSDSFAPIVLMKDLESGEAGQPAAAIVLRHTPMEAAQGRLAAAAPAGQAALQLDTDARCWSGPPACGFAAGDRVLIYTSNAAEAGTVNAIANGVVFLMAPLATAFPKAAVVSTITETTYGSTPDAAGHLRLVRLTDGGAKQPILDHVAHFSIATDDPEVGSPRLLSLRLRVQTAAAHLRGPAGYLFAEPGTAAGPRQWLPDVELRAEVALRNRMETP